MAIITKQLLTAVAATAGNKTVVDLGAPNVTPFLIGHEATVRFSAHGQTGTAPAWALDGSHDNSTFVANIATSVVAAGEEVKKIVVYRYLRPVVTTAAGTLAGTLSMVLEQK